MTSGTKRRAVLLHVLGALGCVIASGCNLVPIAGPLTPEQCFGDVPYSFIGWITSDEPVDGRDGPPTGRVFVMETAGEVTLDYSPPGADGVVRPLIGRGRCETVDGSTVSKRSIGPTHFGPPEPVLLD